MVRTGAALGQTVRVDADEELVFLDPDSAEQAPARVRPRRWLWLLLAAVLAGGVVVQANRHPSAPAAAPSTRSSTFSEVAPAPKTSDPVTVTQLGQSILGATGGWTLFGRGPGVLVRIVPATGQIDSTVVPSLQSGGPVSFVPAAGEAIIRSIDFVPGYVVPDGQPAGRFRYRWPDLSRSRCRSSVGRQRRQRAPDPRADRARRFRHRHRSPVAGRPQQPRSGR
jgi:hypothetical protein